MRVGELYEILGNQESTVSVTFVQLGIRQSGNELICSPQAGNGYKLECNDGALIIDQNDDTDYKGIVIQAEKLKENIGGKIQSGECKRSYNVYVRVPFQESSLDFPRRIYDTEGITANSTGLFLFFGDYITMKK